MNPLLSSVDLFPINPFGGLPTVSTHAGERAETGHGSHSGGTGFSLGQPGTAETVTIPGLARIHQPSLLTQQDETQATHMQSNAFRSKKVAISSYFVPRLAGYEEGSDQRSNMGLFLVNPYGLLSFHLLCPQVQKVPSKSKSDIFMCYCD